LATLINMIPRSTIALATVGTDKSQVGPWLTVRNLATNEGEDGGVEMIINGPIGSSWWDDSGTASSDFRKQFDAIPKGKKVSVRINSEGGAVGDALEIYNVLQARKADVTCYVDGYALSSASIIALGGGRTVTPNSSLLMIHEPWSMTVGNEEDHQKAAKALAKHGETIASIYAKKNGKTLDEMRKLMRDETWYNGVDAVAAGLSDSDGDEDAAKTGCEEVENSRRALEGRLSTNAFRNAPASLIHRIQNRLKISAPAQASAKNTKTKSGDAGTPDTMFKTRMLAALKKAGITVADDATDEAILAAYENLDRANVEASALADKSKSDVAAMQKQLDSEKRIRVTAEVTRRAENRIETKNLAWWVTQAMADESAVLAQIDALPVNRPGGEPLGVSVSVVEDRLDKIRNEQSPEKRYGIVRADFTNLYQAAVARDNRQRQSPMAANTYSSTLVTNFLLDGCVTKLQNRWAALRSFSRDFSVDRYKPRATGQLKKVTAGGTVQTNATNFESGNSTVTNVQIAVDQYSAAFHVTNDELNSGLRMDNLVDVNVAALADKILGVAFAPLATGAFTTNAKITSAPAAFSFSDMADAWGKLKKSPTRSAILDGEYLARILNQPAFQQVAGTEPGEGWNRFGWDGVHLNTNWTGTHDGADDQYIRGLFCNPQCLGVIAGLPLTPPNVPGAILQESTIQVPGVDINVAAYSWFSTATRSMWMSYDIMFGAALVDESAGVLLTSQ